MLDVCDTFIIFYEDGYSGSFRLVQIDKQNGNKLYVVSDDEFFLLIKGSDESLDQKMFIHRCLVHTISFEGQVISNLDRLSESEYKSFISLLDNHFQSKDGLYDRKVYDMFEACGDVEGGVYLIRGQNIKHKYVFYYLGLRGSLKFGSNFITISRKSILNMSLCTNSYEDDVFKDNSMDDGVIEYLLLNSGDKISRFPVQNHSLKIVEDM